MNSRYRFLAVLLVFSCICFWVGGVVVRPGPITLAGISEVDLVAGEECELIFEVVEGGEYTEVDLGSKCLTPVIYRDDRPLELGAHQLRLRSGDEIRLKIRTPHGEVGTAAGTITIRHGVAVLCEAAWRVRYYAPLQLTFSKVFDPRGVVSGWDIPVDMEWRLVNRVSSTGWVQRLRVSVESGGRLSAFAVNEDSEGSVTIMARIYATHQWGYWSRGRLRVELDESSCFATWAVPVAQLNAKEGSGLLVAEAGTGAWGEEVRSPLPPAWRGQDLSVLSPRVVVHGCHVDSRVDHRSHELVCRVRAELTENWHAVVVLARGEVTVRYTVIPSIP